MKTKTNGVAWLLLVVLMLSTLSGCGVILPEPTATPTPTDTPEPPTETPLPPTETPLPTPTETPTLPPTNTLPPPPPTPAPPTVTPFGQKPIYIYFVQENTGGNVGCGDSLVAIQTGLFTSDDLIYDMKRALQQLFIYKTEYFGTLRNPFYLSTISVASVSYMGSGDRVSVELSGTYEPTSDKCDGTRAFAMLTATIRQFPGVAGNPSISLNGAGIKNFLFAK